MMMMRTRESIEDAKDAIASRFRRRIMRADQGGGQGGAWNDYDSMRWGWYKSGLKIDDASFNMPDPYDPSLEAD